MERYWVRIDLHCVLYPYLILEHDIEERTEPWSARCIVCCCCSLYWGEYRHFRMTKLKRLKSKKTKKTHTKTKKAWKIYVVQVITCSVDKVWSRIPFLDKCHHTYLSLLHGVCAVFCITLYPHHRQDKRLVSFFWCMWTLVASNIFFTLGNNICCAWCLVGMYKMPERSI